MHSNASQVRFLLSIAIPSREPGAQYVTDLRQRISVLDGMCIDLTEWGEEAELRDLVCTLVARSRDVLAAVQDCDAVYATLIDTLDDLEAQCSHENGQLDK